MWSRWTSTAPIGIPPSASPRFASSIATRRNESISRDCASTEPGLTRHRCPARLSHCNPSWRFRVMLHMALVFLVIGIIAALLGFTTIAGAAFGIAKFLAGLFLLLFLVFLIIGLTAARRIID